MEKLTYENLSSKLVEIVPEIREKYEEKLKWWDDETPGPHIIYGDVLTPYLISLIESKGDHDEILKRIFDFLEVLAKHEDEHVQEVVAVTVCERLIDNKRWIQKAREYMGTETLKISYEMEKAWYGEKGSPE